MPDSVDFETADGWTGFLLWGEGLPLSVNVLEVEMVLHLEGIPQLNSSDLTPSGVAIAGHQDPTGMEKSIARYAAEASISVVSEAASMYGGAGAGRLADRGMRALIARMTGMEL
jgi:hypothetical protein